MKEEETSSLTIDPCTKGSNFDVEGRFGTTPHRFIDKTDLPFTFHSTRRRPRMEILVIYVRGDQVKRNEDRPFTVLDLTGGVWVSSSMYNSFPTGGRVSTSGWRPKKLHLLFGE